MTIHIEIAKSEYSEGWHIRIGDIEGSSESGNISIEEIIEDIKDAMNKELQSPQVKTSVRKDSQETGNVSPLVKDKPVDVIILDNNPLSIAKYAEEYPENWKKFEVKE